MLGIARTYQGRRWESSMEDAPSQNNWGPTVTASGTTHTKGNYVQLEAATTYDWYGFWLMCSGSSASANATNQLLDLAIGAAASEQIILPDFMSGWHINQIPTPYFIPIYIPRGTRIAARVQAQIASDTVDVCIWGNASNSGLPGPLFSNCDAYGITSASSNGTTVTAGNSGTPGSDTNIGSTTSRTYGGVYCMASPNGLTTVSSLGYTWELRIGSVTVAEWHEATTTAEVRFGLYPPTPIPTPVLSGTQLQVRGACSGTNQAHTVALYCFY